jgi:ABC-type oligopeptide transport system substrate-binding subunit/tetratricopeptide (TPR) repeat protein
MMAKQMFVGRERELSQLQAFLDQALAGQSQSVFVTGEAGSGKTALIHEFARRSEASHTDLVVAIGNCNAQTGLSDPYLPFREVLRLLIGDVEGDMANNVVDAENAARLRRVLVYSFEVLVEFSPDLVKLLLASIPGAGLLGHAGAFLVKKAGLLDKLKKLTQRKEARVGDTDLEQSHIFEQYTNFLQTLAPKQPLMLVLDDLHWADAASISLLFHLGRELRESCILMVGAYRPDEVAMGRGGERHPLEKVLAEFKRYFGDTRLDLGLAQEAEGRQFVDALLDIQPNRWGEDFRQALFRRTEGHPLFTAELLRDMQERGDVVQDEQGCWVEGPALDWETLPARVEGVIEERIGRLEEELREILSVASVEGETFTAQVIARVQEVKERQLLRQLSEELDKRHRLVRERGEVRVEGQFLCRYQFAHALFERYLYNGLSAGERRLLHGEIATALEELYQGHTEEITVQLARHYAEAGNGEKAVGYLLQAGDRARGLYAYREAIDHYQRALEFLKAQGEYERAARTLMKLGLTYHIAFDFQQSRQAYEEGFALWQRVGESHPAALPPAPHTLRIPWHDPPSLDPIMAMDTESSGVIDQLFSGLVAMSPEMDVVPEMARTWEVLESGRAYIFHLREDARWSDGTPVTAADFEHAWKRVLDPATSSPNASFLFDVKGARAYHQGEVSSPEHVGVRALDQFTLLVNLEEPTSYFPHLLTCNATYPVPRHVVEIRGVSWTETGNIVTNGPFRLEAWHPGQSLVLTHNPGYPGRFAGNVQQVELSLCPDWITVLETYEAGGLDIFEMLRLPLAERDRARQQHAGEYVSGPELSTGFVVFNVSQPPFDNPRVRQAFAQAINREILANVILRGSVFPATGGFVPPGMPGHSAGIGLRYDPDQARQLLAWAGYPGGQGFPVVELLTAQTDFAARVGEYLQAQWRENLGVEITWKAAEWAALLDKVHKSPPHLFLSAWRADYPDPHNFLSVCLGQPWTKWRNAAHDKLVEEARRATDQGERMKLYQQADQILIKEIPIMPLTYRRIDMLVKPWVRKYPTSASRWWFWKDVIIEPH